MRFMVRKTVQMRCPVEAEDEKRAMALAGKLPESAWASAGLPEFDIDFPASEQLRASATNVFSDADLALDLDKEDDPRR